MIPRAGFWLIALILWTGCSNSRNTVSFPIKDYADIDIMLTRSAHSSVRMNKTILEIADRSSAIFTERKAVTIFDREARRLGELVLIYNDFIQIEYLKANVYDKNGKLLRSFNLNDASDYSTADGATFFTDSRVKVLELTNNSYPYTIEYEYTQSYTGLLNLPTWRPQILGQSIEQASFTIIDRTGENARFHQKNLENEPEVNTLNDGSVSYTWEILNSEAIPYEPYSPHYSEIIPQVHAAPGKFKMDESQGDARSWKSFGKWYYELGKDTRTLPKEAQLEIDNIVRFATNEHDSVIAVYRYLQEKTRYVSIQLGIGGWKPFSAEYVYENSFGDCKALTNYMQAALEYLGIKGEAVLINSGIGAAYMMTDFPSNQFNHVVIRVTLKDGNHIWLECTSKYIPVNHLGAGNYDKHALLITQQGGVIVKTPSNVFSDNTTYRTINYEISEDGTVGMTVLNSSSGTAQDMLLYSLLPVSVTEREQWLKNRIRAQKVELLNYDLADIADSESGRFMVEARISDHHNVAGKRIYLPVNKMVVKQFQLPVDANRTYPIHMNLVFNDTDSVIVKLPESFKVEYLPQNVVENNELGQYQLEFTMPDPRTLIYRRHFSIKEQIGNPENYQIFREFFNTVRSADSKEIVLVRS